MAENKTLNYNKWSVLLFTLKFLRNKKTEKIYIPKFSYKQKFSDGHCNFLINLVSYKPPHLEHFWI